MKKAWYLDEDILLVGTVEGKQLFPGGRRLVLRVLPAGF